ncbi:hypothetical protein MARINOS108_110105 [Marinoscillum sp. 108]|nr:hypothetical protein MARINOS108_110105 [Marinoscillum sp. 108]
MPNLLGDLILYKTQECLIKIFQLSLRFIKLGLEYLNILENEKSVGQLC